MPTRAARSRSPSAGPTSVVVPSAPISSSDSIWAETFWKPIPVPCVPVEIEPASVCLSMSPRLAKATPSSSCMRRLRSPSSAPASTLTRPEERSKSRIRSSASIRSSVPSVSAAPLNEWPEPATLILLLRLVRLDDRADQALAGPRPHDPAAGGRPARAPSCARSAALRGPRHPSPGAYPGLPAALDACAGGDPGEARGAALRSAQALRSIATSHRSTDCDCPASRRRPSR